jgi:DNA polymerase-3 subunit chi
MPNGATCLMTVVGADVSPGEVQLLDRVCVLFDGNDDAAVAHARTQWKALTDAGCAAQYWSEASGRWEKKAEKEGAG